VYSGCETTPSSSVRYLIIDDDEALSSCENLAPSASSPSAASASTWPPPTYPRKSATSLTEWVDVIAFSEAMQARLLACEKGETIAVSGNVPKKFYQRRNGETAQGRTIVADYIRAAGASIAPPGSRGRADDKPEPAPNPNAPPEQEAAPGRRHAPARNRSSGHCEPYARW